MISWSGSIEIGVTECDPETVELPACATNLRHGSWIMTSSGIVHDGERIVELYGTDLSSLDVGSTLGVMRTSNVCSFLFNASGHARHVLLFISFFNYIFLITARACILH